MQGCPLERGKRTNKFMVRGCFHWLAQRYRHRLSLAPFRRGGRAVEGTGLENRQGFTLLVGSNPTPSARLIGALGPRFCMRGNECGIKSS